MSEYNKYWNQDDDKRLYETLDWLDRKGIKFGITNLYQHKGMTNTEFESWFKKYKIERISSNYISFNDNSVKYASIELYVHN